MPEYFGDLAVERQDRDETSTLNLSRSAPDLRSALGVGSATLVRAEAARGFLDVETSSVRMVANVSGDDVLLDGRDEILLASDPETPSTRRVTRDSTVWLRPRGLGLDSSSQH